MPPGLPRWAEPSPSFRSPDCPGLAPDQLAVVGQFECPQCVAFCRSASGAEWVKSGYSAHGAIWPKSGTPLWSAQRQQADVRSWRLPMAGNDHLGAALVAALAIGARRSQGSAASQAEPGEGIEHAGTPHAPETVMRTSSFARAAAATTRGARKAYGPARGRATTSPPARAHDPSEKAAAPPGRATPSPGHRDNSRAARSG